jgi:type VI secretion system secreted protein Hcp
MPIFMSYDGITGDVTTKGHEQWIEINSFQWGVGRGVTSATASEADREGATPSISEITVNKANDSASPNLFRASCGAGAVGEGKTVKIDFCKTDADQPEPYLQFELENTLISGWTMSSGGDRPSESVSLNFTKITMTNTPMGDDNQTTSPDRPFYDLGQQVGG